MRQLGSLTIKALMVGAVAGVMVLGGIGQAQAGAKAFADLLVTGAVFTDSTGTAITSGTLLTDPANITVVGFNNTGQISGSLDGFGNFQDSNVNVDDCVGTDCPPPNLDLFGMNDINGDLLFSRAANSLAGSLVTAGGANADTAAEVILNTTSSGLSESITGVGATFSFTMAQAQAIQISFNAELMLYVELHQTDGFVFASSAWSVQITDPNGGVVLAWTPDGLANAPGCAALAGCIELADAFDMSTSRTLIDMLGPQQVNDMGFFNVQTGVLAPNTIYTLSIAHEVNVDAQATKVPEPTTLGLFGIGLLGLGLMMGWRRRETAA